MPILALAGAGLAWIGLVAFMTERGYAGNQRYLIVTTAAICVLGGIGAGRLLQGLRVRPAQPRVRIRGRAWPAWPRRSSWVLALLSPFIGDKVDNVRVTLDELRYEASLWGNLPDAIERAGGRDRLLACGSVYSGPFQTQMVAYEMGVHGIDVGALGGTPATGGRVPHEHRARRAAGGQAHRRPLPAGRAQRALAGGHGAALRRPRLRLPSRGARRAARDAPLPDTRAHVFPLTIFA